MGEWCAYNLPEANSILKDWLEIGLNAATLATTIFFTRQLVQNDNRRSKRDELERLKVTFRNHLEPVAHLEGSLQARATGLRRRFPDNKTEILDAYEDLYAIRNKNSGYIEPDRFRELLKKYEPNKDW